MKRIFRCLLAFLVMSAALLALTGCSTAVSLAERESIGEIYESIRADLFGEKTQTYETVTVTLPRHAGYAATEDRSAFDALTTDAQREAYTSIEQSLFNITDEWVEKQNAYSVTRALIPEMTSAEIFMVKEAVLCDHPEAFWITGSYDIGSNMHDGTYVVLYSAFPYKEVFTKTIELQQNVISALKEIPSNRSEYERELIIHDMLVRDIDYADEAVEAAERYTPASTAYGALVNERAICSGYSQAFKLLCNRVGIACATVKGESKNEGHMWNIVRIGGGWYHVDVTWDDPVTVGADGITRYDYFNLTEKWIACDHKIAEGYDRLDYLLTQELDDDYRAFFNFPLPECTAERYNFYEQNAKDVTALNDENAEMVAGLMKKMCETGDCYMYLRFPKSMSQSKVIEWINSSVGGAVPQVNEYAEKFGYKVIEGCSRTVREEESALTPWNNVYCIMIQYYS